MKRNRIVVVGSSNTDMIIQMQRIPKPGETLLGGEFSMAAGGKGANQAVAAARAGGSVMFVGKVGQDLFGKQAVEGFIKDRINVQYVVADKATPSGVALIFVAKDGENSIAVASGANARLKAEDIEKAKSVFDGAAVMLIQLEIPLGTVKKAIETAFAKGVRVILNPAPAQPLPAALLKKVAVLTPNETEAELLTGVKVTDTASAAKAADVLLKKGIGTVIITLGAKGALVATRQEKKRLPGYKVKAVDATAAGDVFNGALAVALSEKKGLEEAVVFANAAAALSVTKLGAQPSAPKRSEIEKIMGKSV